MVYQKDFGRLDADLAWSWRPRWARIRTTGLLTDQTRVVDSDLLLWRDNTSYLVVFSQSRTLNTSAFTRWIGHIPVNNSTEFDLNVYSLHYKLLGTVAEVALVADWPLSHATKHGYTVQSLSNGCRRIQSIRTSNMSYLARFHQVFQNRIHQIKHLRTFTGWSCGTPWPAWLQTRIFNSILERFRTSMTTSIFCLIHVITNTDLEDNSSLSIKSMEEELATTPLNNVESTVLW